MLQIVLQESSVPLPTVYENLYLHGLTNIYLLFPHCTCFLFFFLKVIYLVMTQSFQNCVALQTRLLFQNRHFFMWCIYQRVDLDFPTSLSNKESSYLVGVLVIY